MREAPLPVAPQAEKISRSSFGSVGRRLFIDAWLLQSPLALPRQPLVERGKVDHHALMGAAADLFGLVVRRDLEFDSLALNLDDLGFGVDLVADGWRPSPAPVDFRISEIMLDGGGKSLLYPALSRPSEGRCARYGRGAGCGGRGGACDERCRRGRRSRVVLTPQSLASSLREEAQATVSNKRGHRGEREISRKPLRGECRVVPV